MVNSVTFSEDLGGDGSTVTDDADPNTGLANGGHRERYVPTLAQTVVMARTATDKAAAANNSAQAAASSAQQASNDRDAISLNRQELDQRVQDADASATAAADSAATASNMADAVAQSTATYTSESEGLANTTDTEYFRVIAAPNATEVAVYRNDAGSATPITTYYTQGGVDERNRQATRLARSLQRRGDAGQIVHADFDLNAYGRGSVMSGGIDEPLAGEELLAVQRATPKRVLQPSGPNGQLRLTVVPPDTVARHWDLATGQPLGALFEQSWTNIALYSEDWTSGGFGAGWNQGVGFFRDMVAGDHPEQPDITVCHFGPEDGQDAFNNSINHQTLDTLGEAGTYIVMADYKAIGDVEDVRFLHAPIDGGGTVGGVLHLTGSGGARNSNFQPGDSFGEQLEFDAVPLGNGWYRCYVVFTTVRAIGELRMRAFPYNGTTPLMGDGSSGLHGTMARVGAGDRAGSYVKTGAAPETREADWVQGELPALPHSGFTVYVEAMTDPTGNNFSGNYFSLTDGNLNDSLTVTQTKSNNARALWYGPSGTRFAEREFPCSRGQVNRIAVSVTPTRMEVTVNGTDQGGGDVAEEADIALLQYLLLTNLRSLNDSFQVEYKAQSEVRVYPEALSATQRQELTS